VLRWITENPSAWPLPFLGFLMWRQDQLLWALVQRLDTLTQAVGRWSGWRASGEWACPRGATGRRGEGTTGRWGDGAMVVGSRRRLASAVVWDVGMFGRWGLPTVLRGYQLEVARAVVRSVVRGEGVTFTVLFPRQAGKNELSAQLEAFLLFRHQGTGGSIVKAAPTFRPQIVNSMRRLEKI
jgi:hypothetical protein